MRRFSKPASRPSLRVLLAAALLLSACGQAGPLYLPDSSPTPGPTAAPTAAPTPGAEPAAEPGSAPTTPAATAAPQTPQG